MYLFIDTETGGLTTDYSLLTATFIATDNQLNIISIDGESRGITLHIKSEKYVVNAKALSVNNIDLRKHDEIAIDVHEAKAQLIDYIEKVIVATNRKKLVPAGHNLEFDQKFLLCHLLCSEDWNKYFTYPALDTYYIARYVNALNQNVAGYSLTKLINQFAPEYDYSNSHTSYEDVMATIYLAKKLIV